MFSDIHPILRTDRSICTVRILLSELSQGRRNLIPTFSRWNNPVGKSGAFNPNEVYQLLVDDDDDIGL
jgi:hypothetical protein